MSNRKRKHPRAAIAVPTSLDVTGTASGKVTFETRPVTGQRHCGECLWNAVEIVVLDERGICPRCNADYGPDPS